MGKLDGQETRFESCFVLTVLLGISRKGEPSHLFFEELDFTPMKVGWLFIGCRYVRFMQRPFLSDLTSPCRWEPEENLQGCPRLLESFWQDVGTDDRDYPIGYITEPSTEWIGELDHTPFVPIFESVSCSEKERAFFAKEYQSLGKKENSQPKKEGRKDKDKKKVKVEVAFFLDQLS